MADKIIAEGVELCPFLRNIHQPTVFSFSSLPAFQFPSVAKGGRGPIFEDGPNFEIAFRLFHGRDGVIPLSEDKVLQNNTSRSNEAGVENSSDVFDFNTTLISSRTNSSRSFHPLASSAATISLSSFGAFGPFGFDAFFGKGKASDKKHAKGNSKEPSRGSKSDVHLSADEAMGSEWLLKGSCPIAKSYRAVSGVLPFMENLLKSHPELKYKCPPAIVAARAAIARTAVAKSLRPQPLPAKVLAIGLLGMAVNVPLGVWREHTKKFSPSWFVAVHASVPFIAMLRKAIHLPKYAMAFTIASAILGQVIGSRAERYRIATASTQFIDEFKVPSQKLAPLSITKPDYLKETVSLEGQVQDKRQSDALHYRCAKDLSDATRPAGSISAPVGAF